VRFTPTSIDGVFVVDLEPIEDERGFFARAYCARELAEHGVALEAVQANLARNVHAGTVRGLHFQDPSAPEAKLFRCIRGETFHVAVDAREGSPTRYRWFGVRLSADNRRALYMPPVCAAGYQALTPGAEILYLCGGAYDPGAERGLSALDPVIGIDWPLPPAHLSDKDRGWPLLDRPTGRA
jgi:dTDP-4-dehydrorhamnose 3,5-epimerase